MLTNLQLGLTNLLRKVLTVQVRDSEALLLRHWGTLDGLHCTADLLQAALLLLDDLHLGLTLGHLHQPAHLLLPHLAVNFGHIETLFLLVGRTPGLRDREADVLVAVAALGLVGALADLLVLHPTSSPLMVGSAGVWAWARQNPPQPQDGAY